MVNTIKSTISKVFSAIWSGIKTTVSGIYNTVKDGLNNAVNFITGLASSAFSWGADIINGIINGIKSCISKVKEAGIISIPVYLGNSLLDEIIVDAQQRQNLRSGGR